MVSVYLSRLLNSFRIQRIWRIGGIGLAMMLCTSCTMTEIHEHPETKDIVNVTRPQVSVSNDSFDSHSDFVDDGILFLPMARCICWKKGMYANILFFSKDAKWIYVSEVVARNSDGDEVVIQIEKSYFLDKSQNGLFKNHTYAKFRGLPNADRVLSGGSIELQIKYWIGNKPGDGEPESMTFKLEPTTEHGSIFDNC